MRDDAWSRGIARLVMSGFAGWPTVEAESAARAAAYREVLDELSDAQWAHAVKTAQQSGGRFFPAIPELYAWGMDYRPPDPPRLQEPATGPPMSPAQVLAELARRAGIPMEDVVKEMPGAKPRKVKNPRRG